MTTMREVVQDAFEEIGVKTAEVALTNDELQSGIRRCNDLLTQWDDTGVIVGYNPVLNGDDTLEIDRNAVRAIKKSLAMDLAPSYQKVVSQALAAAVNDSYNALLVSGTNLSNVTYPDTLPLGSGNDCDDNYFVDDRFFPENKTDNF